MKPKTARLMSLIALGIFAACATVHAENAAAGAKPNIHEKTLWEQIREGGWVMFPIALCSIGTLYLIGDGIIRTSSKRVLPPDHITSVQSLFRQGDYSGTY